MKGILNRGTQVHKVRTKYNRLRVARRFNCETEDMENTPKTVVTEKNSKSNVTTQTPPRIGYKVYFEVNDELHENKMRLVHAKILRQYPRQLGKCCEYLAFDCIDLDNSSIVYTVPYDEKFIKTDIRGSKKTD